MDISLILENIIKRNSSLSPVVIIDESGILEEFLTDKDFVYFIEQPSQIELSKVINAGKVNCIYMKFFSAISGFVSTGKVKQLSITPELLLNEIKALRGKVTGSINLTEKQFMLFVNNFNSVVEMLLSFDRIDTDVIQNVLTKHILGRKKTVKELLLAVLNQELPQNKLYDYELLQSFQSLVNSELSIPIHLFTDYNDILSKTMFTYSKIQYNEIGGSTQCDFLLNVIDSAVNSLAQFIMENANDLKQGILRLNKVCIGLRPQNITYALPDLFVKYMGEHVDEFAIISINKERLWTSNMKLVGEFVLGCRSLDNLLNRHISYITGMNTIDQLWVDYKMHLADIDTEFRNIESVLEKLSYELDFYLCDGVIKVMADLRNRYHNVIGNTNGRLLRYYETFMAGRSSVTKQSELFEKLTFPKRTLFIFADGFRYEMAKELKSRFSDCKIEDLNVIGELPSETEVGMNSYFIINEKVRLNEKNVFELIKDGKTIFQINDWRKRNLIEKLGCQVISFKEFMQNRQYEESVICFFNETDINMHQYDSACKMSEAISNLEKIIRYALSRKFDVMLLSDHGFVDIEKKLDLQDKSLEADKKKSRYLILNKNEKVDSLYYCDNIPGAKYLEMGNKKLCFINSTNSLRETSRYNHGGISLQENVITALRFKGVVEEEKSTLQVIFDTLKAYNELTGKIKGAKGSMCNVLCGTEVIYTSMIGNDEYYLQVPIRQYEKNTDFLVMVSDGISTKKTVIKKEGSRTVDKDLDIFS